MCVLKLLKALKKICIFIMPAKKKQSRVAKLLSWKKKVVLNHLLIFSDKFIYFLFMVPDLFRCCVLMKIERDANQ